MKICVVCYIDCVVCVEQNYGHWDYIKIVHRIKGMAW